MPGISLAAALTGLGQGYEQNAQNAALERERRLRIQQMQQQLDAQNQEKRQRAAAAAWLLAQGGLPGAGGQSLTGAPSPPPQSSAPPPVSDNAPAPVPTGAPPPAPPGASPAPSGPTMVQPTTPPPSAAPGASGAPPGASDTPTFEQLAKQSFSQIADIAKGVAAANPGMKPEDILGAVDDILKEQKSLDPTERLVVESQLNMLKAQTAWYNAQTGRQRAETAAGSLAERAAHDRATELNASNRTHIYAEMATLSHADRQAAIAAMNERAANSINDRDRIEASREASEMARLDEAIENKDWATVAQIQAGEVNAINRTRNPTQPGVAAPAIAPRPKLGGRGAGGTIQPKGAPLTPKLKADYQAAAKAGNGAEAKRRLQSAGYDTTGL